MTGLVTTFAFRDVPLRTAYMRKALAFGMAVGRFGKAPLAPASMTTDVTLLQLLTQLRVFMSGNPGIILTLFASVQCTKLAIAIRVTCQSTTATTTRPIEGTADMVI